MSDAVIWAVALGAMAILMASLWWLYGRLRRLEQELRGLAQGLQKSGNTDNPSPGGK